MCNNINILDVNIMSMALSKPASSTCMFSLVQGSTYGVIKKYRDLFKIIFFLKLNVQNNEPMFSFIGHSFVNC